MSIALSKSDLQHPRTTGLKVVLEQLLVDEADLGGHPSVFQGLPDAYCKTYDLLIRLKNYSEIKFSSEEESDDARFGTEESEGNS